MHALDNVGCPHSLSLIYNSFYELSKLARSEVRVYIFRFPSFRRISDYSLNL